MSDVGVKEKWAEASAGRGNWKGCVAVTQVSDTGQKSKQAGTFIKGAVSREWVLGVD
jgi:hypothetical protein